MALVTVQGDTVSAPSYIPPTPGVTATGFATISGNEIIVNGDSIASHYQSGGPTHSNAKMVNTLQSFVTIEGVPVILAGDGSDASPTHHISSSIQSFVTITP